VAQRGEPLVVCRTEHTAVSMRPAPACGSAMANKELWRVRFAIVPWLSTRHSSLLWSELWPVALRARWNFACRCNGRVTVTAPFESGHQT
jgi:hypothetical protein